MLNVTILACLLILTGCFGLFDDGDVIDDADGGTSTDNSNLEARISALEQAHNQNLYLTFPKNLSGVDLSYADLRFFDLSGVDLSGANLYGTDMRFVDLSGANLYGADLINVNLRWANLNGANLSYADLSSAYLHGVDLSYADLSSADLSGAYLNGANLSYADLSSADLSGAHLDDVIWLSTTCPDGTNSNDNGDTCENNLTS